MARKRLDAQLTTLDCEIAAYTATLDANDAAEAAEPAAKPGEDWAGKLTALL
ncbi:MAG: hypothetical protein JWM91_2156, partial [Rhodospirillales bacterium]|nr:hypothetical protein [Rhodospirillales bacterium]